MKVKCILRNVKLSTGEEFLALCVNKNYIENPTEEIKNSEAKTFNVRLARKSGIDLKAAVPANARYCDIEATEGQAFLSKKTKYPTIVIRQVDSIKGY